MEIIKLTDREKEIAKCIIKGDSNKEIAQKLNLSTHTIKFIVSTLIQKMKAENRTHIAFLIGSSKNLINQLK